MLVKNRYTNENNKRKSNGKSVGKVIKTSNLVNIDDFNYKYFDDTNIKSKYNYYFLMKNLSKSSEQEDSTLLDSKELSSSNNESFSITSQSSLSIINQETKVFKNLQVEGNIQEKIIKKRKYNKIQKQIKLSILPEEFYDENTKYDFLKKIKPKGLMNLGGCCYMNATLQCFYHIKELTFYFLDNKRDIKRKKGVLSMGYLDLVEGLSKLNNEKYYAPQKFKNSLLEIDDSFRGSEGKDSGDLIELMLYNFQQELGGDSDFPDMSIDQRESRLIYLDLYYRNSKVRSIISDLFNFEVNSASKCLSCGVPFYNISTEYSILFSLEGVYNCMKKNNNQEENGNIISFHNHYQKRVSLEECLTHYTLDGALNENAFCKYCNKNSSILTTRSFLTLPNILILIMSRGEREKFECDVDFEEELDLNDLYSGMKGIDRDENTKYTLLAGTILLGSGGWGHTIAFARHFDGEYYIFNDSSTRKSSFGEIKKSKVYLLFYKKTNY